MCIRDRRCWRTGAIASSSEMSTMTSYKVPDPPMPLAATSYYTFLCPWAVQRSLGLSSYGRYKLRYPPMPIATLFAHRWVCGTASGGARAKLAASRYDPLRTDASRCASLLSTVGTQVVCRYDPPRTDASTGVVRAVLGTTE
eukprot:3453270-Rhodomonas_salina.5